MPDKIESATREQVAEFLPRAIKKALTSYHNFMGNEVPGDAKGFSQHHSACKVAIAHVELLLDLARWADLPGDEKEGRDYQKLAGIVTKAEQQLTAFQEQQGEEEPEEDG